MYAIQKCHPDKEPITKIIKSPKLPQHSCAQWVYAIFWLQLYISDIWAAVTTVFSYLFFMVLMYADSCRHNVFQGWRWIVWFNLESVQHSAASLSDSSNVILFSGFTQLCFLLFQTLSSSPFLQIWRELSPQQYRMLRPSYRLLGSCYLDGDTAVWRGRLCSTRKVTFAKNHKRKSKQEGRLLNCA